MSEGRREKGPPERPWAFDPEHICNAPLLMMDDHWGAIRQTCDLISGHQGDHAAELRSCVPVAVLSWPQNDLHTAAESGRNEEA